MNSYFKFRVQRPFGSVLYNDDDYFETNEKYFSSILKNSDWSALPAGWLNPFLGFSGKFKSINPDVEGVKYYTIDESDSLFDSKKYIANLMSAWEGREIGIKSMTIGNSVTSTLLLTMMCLKEQGYKNIFFETPVYFSTYDQAKLLDLNTFLIPTWIDDDFMVEIERWIEIVNSQGPSVIWITQPRFGIGTNQPVEKLQALIGMLNKESVIVIDEASEQFWPSHLSCFHSKKPAVIKIRSIFKPLGLHGFRISVILHPESWRDHLLSVLDKWSLQLSG